MGKPIVIAILANASQANKTLNQTASLTQRVGGGFRKMALPAVAALGIIGQQATVAGKALMRIEAINAQTTASIKSTGGAAGVTADHVERLAGRLETLTATEAEMIQENANLLLTFTNVRNEAGKGNKVYDQAVKIFVDMKRAMPTASMAGLGKALNDPIKGISALSRVGVSFTKQQKDQITTLVESGDTLKAQKIILAELRKEFGGSGKAYAATDAGQAELAAHKYGELTETLATKLMPAWQKVVKFGLTATEFLSEHSDATEKTVVVVASLAAGVLAVNAAMKVGAAVTAVYTAATTASALASRVATSASLGTRLGLASLAVQQKATTASTALMDAATGRSTKGAMLLRGGTLAAGASLVALGQSGDRGSTSLGKVATVAGAAAAGFAVGGPWGAVLGAGAALLGVGTKSEESARRQQAFLDMQTRISEQSKTLASTLNQQSGAITKLTRQTVAKNLAENGAYTAGLKVGVSYSTVTKAALGNAQAQARVKSATDSYIRSQVRGKSGLDEFRKAMADAKDATGPLTTAVGVFSSELGAVERSTKQAKAAIRSMSNEANNASPLMASAGAQAGAGFHNGLKGWLGPIADIGRQIAATVEKAAKDKLKVKSPSRVFHQIGANVGQGFAIGITSTAGLAVTAITRTAARTERAARAAARKTQAQLYRENKSRLAALKAQSKDYAAAVASSARDYASLSTLQLGENENLTAATIKQHFTDRLAAIRNFQNKLAALQKRGISKELYDQIVQQGVEQGGAYADALVASSPAALKEIDSLQKQIGSASGSLGKATASTMYKSGIDSAQGFINGIKKMLSNAARVGGTLGKTLVRSLKRALGIRSPSRVLAQVGRQSVDGLEVGLNPTRVKAQGAALSKALVKGYASPELDAQMRLGFAQMDTAKSTKTTGDTYNVYITLNDTMSEAEQGRKVWNAIREAKRNKLVPTNG